jgi:diguanylate cyclase (GGDEF)-like protein
MGADLSIGLLVAVCCLVGWATRRAVVSLAGRHRSLRRLHELSDALVAAPASSDIVGLVLAQSIELMGARYAEVCLAQGQGAPARSWVLRVGQQPLGPCPPVPVGVDSLATGARPQREVRPTSPAQRRFLEARGLKEALAVPMRDQETTTGYLIIGDRSTTPSPGGDGDGRLLETVANHASVALRNARLIHRLHFEARHDELTGLPNRLYLRESLDEVATQGANGGAPCVVMVLDFDGFKSINDTLGHQAGDELLRILAARLAEAASDASLVARLGGDEFAILSTGHPTAPAATDLAHRILGIFVEPVLVAGARLRLGGSLGIALGPEHGKSGSDLLRNADIALYAA